MTYANTVTGSLTSAANKIVRTRMDFRSVGDLTGSSLLWNELRKPLYSAIAARLVLYTANATIPEANNIQAQAEFWAEHYNTNGSISDFIASATGLRGMY